MKSVPTVSVIIPTYNRKQMLQETLQSLAQQTFPPACFEVIVVDDGSTDETDQISALPLPFALRYLRQSNQGDAVARNYGAQQSQADILVFLDDDMLLEPDYLKHVIHAHDHHPNRIVVGTWELWQAEATPFSQSINASLPTGAYYARPDQGQDTGLPADHADPVIELPFRDAYSNNMSIRRQAYLDLGMMHSLAFSGSSMWCDLDFAYRAHQQGYEFRRSARVLCWHRDHSVRDLQTYSQRMRTAAYRAVELFRQHPDLIAHLPMFYDKTRINWGHDSPRLIARKFARSVASSRLSLWGLRQVASLLEKRNSGSSLLPVLYRYIIAGSIFQGYREGLKAGSGALPA